jgi:hypothetical protein
MVPSHKSRNIICNCIHHPHSVLFTVLENNVAVKVYNEVIKKLDN